MILSHTPPCSCKSKEKEKEKKRNINNDLAVLPSHDTIPPSDPYAPFEEAPNSVPISKSDISMEPFPPLVIPYSTNALVDPSL